VELVLSSLQSACKLISERVASFPPEALQVPESQEDEVSSESLLEKIKIEVIRVLFRVVQNYSEAVDSKCPQYYSELMLKFILEQTIKYDKERHTTILMCTDFLRIFFSAVTHQAHVNCPSLLSNILYLL